LPAGSILDPVAHDWLIRNLDTVAQQAGVEKALFHHSAKTVLDKDELAWLLSGHKTKPFIALGPPAKSAAGRCAALTAALIRNFVDAKMVYLHRLLKDEPPECTVMVIPDFYVPVGGQSPIKPWEPPILQSRLMERRTQGLPTVVYVEGTTKQMEQHYGQWVAGIFKNPGA
jgi:hypothetical protein